LWHLFGDEEQILEEAEVPPLHHSPIQPTAPLFPCPEQPPPPTAQGVTILADSDLTGIIVILHHLTGIYTVEDFPHDEWTPMPSYYMIPFALQEGFNTIWWEESDTICHYTSYTLSKSNHPFAIIFPGLHVQHQQQDAEGQYKPSSTQMAFPLLAMKHTPPCPHPSQGPTGPSHPQTTRPPSNWKRYLQAPASY
jgi:hypothetical protein